MAQDIKLIRRILEAIEKSVDMEEWKEEKPKLEGTFGKVSDSGNHEMKNAKDNYANVKGSGSKKIETTPAFSSIKDPGTNGGAKTNAKPGSPKDPFKVDTKSEMKEGSDKTPVVKEVSTNMKKITGTNPAINEEEAPLEEMTVNRRKMTGRPKAIGEAAEFEKTLGEAKAAQAKRLREAIEAISGKIVVYVDKK